MEEIITESLVRFDELNQAIEKAGNLDELKSIRNKAELLRNYVARCGLGLKSQNRLTEIKLKAERKAGEILKEMVKDGTREKPGHYKKSPRVTIENLASLGVSKMQSSRWQALDDWPWDLFKKYLHDAIFELREITSREAYGLAMQHKRSMKVIASRIGIARRSSNHRWNAVAAIGSLHELLEGEFKKWPPFAWAEFTQELENVIRHIRFDLMKGREI